MRHLGKEFLHEEGLHVRNLTDELIHQSTWEVKTRSDLDKWHARDPTSIFSSTWALVSFFLSALLLELLWSHCAWIILNTNSKDAWVTLHRPTHRDCFGVFGDLKLNPTSIFFELKESSL